ncbi:MAG: hypothetical protein ACI31R_06125, partial [Bacilli bacterium]
AEEKAKELAEEKAKELAEEKAKELAEEKTNEMKEEMARKMIKDNIDIQNIAKYTGLKVKQIEKLIN